MGGGGAGGALLAALLLTARGLRCPLCDPRGCRDVTCDPPAICWRTSLSTARAGRVLRRELGGGCAVPGAPDVLITFRSHGEEVTLWEGTETPGPPEPPNNGTRGPAPPPPFCPTCDSTDGSCERPSPSLRCPRPHDACLDVITRAPDGGEEVRLRGCGSGGRCAGLFGLETGSDSGRRLELRCCRGGKCERGAVGLRCLSCGAEPGGCRGASEDCESGVCGEAWADATWSHGRLSLRWRGCGRGLAGSTARALELGGLVVFARRRQCREEACNGELGDSGGHPGNSSAQAPNGLRCYGCADDGPCDAPSIVECYGDLNACFHGNVTMSLGGQWQWQELRGCARAQGCEGHRGDEAVGLSGSCCTGNLCNHGNGTGDAAKTFFAPDRPRLELLPHGHGPTAHPAPTKMADGATKVNGTHKTVNESLNRGNATTNMATTQANMAASTTDTNKVNAGVNINLANTNMATTDPHMATIDPNMAAIDPNMAAIDHDVATGDHGAGPGDKMAAGRAGRKDGAKGRGQALGGVGWLLPLLLLPLL
ncbi:urokinase plasminogen activator surface receptor-like isoform X2 [Cuculus canorus]|uniref:urokinase plasminogen activator surface receptor-like isoform X2 n=1 Tax=Cuculus canorus TaxID=55661 RepID=UPI0023AA328D|nr:urokinase plasminogen activator surface receptor-like isoform X2 [Cuculus canorus]